MDTLRYQHHQALKDKVKEEFVDSGFVEVGSENVHQLCTACLCATRTTHTLDDITLKQYYMNILSETQLDAGEPVLQSPRLCWECVAHLKRSVRFRERVQDSSRLLQPMLAMVDKEDRAKFLQTSVCGPDRLTTCFVYSIDISPQDDDAQTTTAEQHDDDDGAELLLVIKEEAEDEQLQETDAHPRKEVTKYVNTLDISNSMNEFTYDLKSTFTCDYCYKRFSSQPALERHIVATYFMSCNSSETGKGLRRLLSSETVGRDLLTKADKGEKLNGRDRALLVRIIVEAELNDLEEHGKSIKKDVWQKWAKEVADLFADENADMYYVPIHIATGKAIPASGLICNRLLTHRRCINSLKPKRSNRCSDIGSDASSSKCEVNSRKRNRPLPENCNQDDTTTSSTANTECLKVTSSSFNDINNTQEINSDVRQVRTEEDFEDEENTNEENLEAGKVTAQDEGKSEDTLKSKRIRERDFCYYCESLVLNFSRHMVRIHLAEPEVQLALSHPKKSLKRKTAFKELRKKGNYITNSQSAFKPVKKCRFSDKSDYLPCSKCLGFYSKKQLWKHVKKCNNTGPTKNAQVTAQNFLLRHVKTDKSLVEKVFSRMRPDEVSLIAKKDPETEPPPTLQDDDINKSCAKKKRTYVPWTTEQKNVVIKFFKQHIKDKKPPKRGECDALKRKYPTLFHNKDWLNIKAFIQKKYTKT